MSTIASDADSDLIPSPQYEFPYCHTLIPFSEASIIMVYHGLMCLAYSNECGVLEAGMHSKARCHRFKLHIFGFGGNLGNPREIYSFQPDSHKDVPGRVITMDISRPRDPGVCFYKPGTEPVLSWEQCLDLEGPEFYNRRMRKRNVLKPKVTVNHGVFYCFPTPHEYLRYEEVGQSGTNIGTIGFLALGLVRHTGVGSISIINKREKLTLPCSRTNPLLVVISNACTETRCPADQNDFPEYYRVVKLRSHERRYRLQRRRQLAGLNLAGVSSFSSLLSRTALLEILSSIEAPCGFSVLGRSRGIDDNDGT